MDSFFGLDKPSAHARDAKLLTTVYGNIELSIVRSILEAEQIPYRVRERGAGGVVRLVAGDSPFGCDILVPADIFEQASELLDAYRSAEETADNAEEAES